MRPRSPFRALAAPLLLLALAGCASSSLKLAPASATTPYRGSAGTAATDPGAADYGVTPDPSMPIAIAALLDAAGTRRLAPYVRLAVPLSAALCSAFAISIMTGDTSAAAVSRAITVPPGLRTAFRSHDTTVLIILLPPELRNTFE